MKTFARNALAIIVGLICGSLVNGCIIEISGFIIAPPKGIDATTLEGLKASMPLFEPKHYLLPFIAHALGTFVGAYIAARVGSKKFICAAIIGVVFLIGGIWMISLVPSPIWFTLVDLLLAYLPMAYLALNLANPKHNKQIDN